MLVYVDLLKAFDSILQIAIINRTNEIGSNWNLVHLVAKLLGDYEELLFILGWKGK